MKPLPRRGSRWAATCLILVALPLATPSPVLDLLAAPDDILNAPNCHSYQCNSGNSDFVEGQVYTYDYDVTSVTQMKSSPQDSSSLGIRSRAQIQVLSSCRFSLQLDNVKIEGNDQTEIDASELSRFPTEFIMESNVISQVCAHQEEPVWITNIKKGVLSNLQSSVPTNELGVNITETDVVGTCLTEYGQAELSTSTLNGYKTYKKTKFMDTCENNQKLYQWALNIPDINIQQLPMIKSHYECQVTTYGLGRVDGSQCIETHLFKPFSSATSGVMTHTQTNLKLIGESTIDSALVKELSSPTEMSVTTLSFDQNFEESENSDYLSKIQTILQEQNPDEKSRPESFTELVHSMRKCSHSQLVQIFQAYPSQETNVLLLDALPLLKTDAAMTLMRDLLESGRVSGQMVDAWMATLPYYKNPTRGMIHSAIVFLDGTPRPSALLGVSTLVHTFCSNRDHCSSIPEVQEILSKYEEFLGSQCQADYGQEEMVILSLKALGNIGRLHRGHEVVQACYQDFTNPMDIRLTALDTIRRVGCAQQSSSAEFDFKPALFTLFSDNNMDSEIRIGAYLALINGCPSSSTVNLIKNILITEPVNQVGSFVWTHLTNIQESQSLSPFKQGLKILIGSEFLQNKWNTDVRKFSRYFETSYFSDELQSGVTTDGQLIFSQNSYLPRSGMVNFTVNLFGENLNLLEVGTRMEGFEGLVESLFGPDGKFRRDTFHQMLQTLRQKRDIDATLAEFQESFNQDMDGSSSTNPNGNIYLRSFGQDVFYTAFDSLNDLAGQFTSFWPFSLVNSLSSRQNIDYDHSSIFLDGKIVIPTIAGLPLSLAVNGTSVLKVQTDNHFDIGNLLQTGDASLQVKIYPTASLQISGEMSVDAVLTKTALKSLSTLHTSTFIDGQVQVEKGQLVKAEVNVPREKMEILEVAINYYALKDNTYTEVTSPNQAVSYYGCTPNGFNQIVGMQLCGSTIFYDNPHDTFDLLFAGPFEAKLALEKVDTFSKYTFEYQWKENEEDSGQQALLAVWDTPGSRVNRRASLNLIYNKVFYNYAALDVQIPVQNIVLNGVFQWSEDKKMIKTALAMEGRTMAQLSYVLEQPQEGRYESQLAVVYQESKIIGWDARLLMTNMKMDGSSTLTGVFLAEPLVGQASLIYSQDDRWNVEGQVNSQWLTSNLNGYFQQSDTSFTLKVKCDYTTGLIKEEIEFQSSYKKNTVGELDKHVIYVNVMPSRYPQWNGVLDWELQMSQDYVENIGKLRLGPHSYTFEQLFSSQATSVFQELLAKLAFKASEMEWTFNLEHRLSAKDSTNRLQLLWPHWIDFTTFLVHQKDSQQQMIEAGLSYDELDLGAKMDLRKNQDTGGYNGNVLARWGPLSESDSNVSMDFDLQNEGTLGAYAVDANLHLPGLDTMSAHGELSLSSDKSSLDLLCEMGMAKHSIALSLEKASSGRRLQGTFESGATSYSFNVLTRYDTVKSIHAQLNLEKTYTLDAVARRNFRDMLFDLSWDNSQSRAMLRAQWLPDKISGEMKLMGNDGLFEVQFLEKAVSIEVVYNDFKGEFNGAYQLEPNNFGITADFTSTCSSLRSITLELTHSLSSTSGLNSRARLDVNDVSYFDIKLAGRKSTDSWLQFEATSLYEALSYVKMRLSHSKVEKEHDFTLVLQYKDDVIDVKSTIDTGKPKSGTFSISTPWSCMNKVEFGYTFNTGRTVTLESYLNWNDKEVVTTNVTGHILPSDVVLDFTVSQQSLGTATGGISYLLSTNGEVKSSVNLTYGLSSFKISGEHTKFPFRVGCQAEIFSPRLKAQTEMNLFQGYGALDIGGKVSVDHQTLLELQWNSWFESIMEHRFEVKNNILGHELNAKANSVPAESSLELRMTQNGALHSEMKLSRTNVRNVDNGDFSVDATLTAPGYVSKDSRIALRHSYNMTQMSSSIEMSTDSLLWKLFHDLTSKPMSNGQLRLKSEIGLETPFDYLTKATVTAEADLKTTLKENGLKAAIAMTFDETVLNLEMDANMDLSSPLKSYNLEVKSSGTYGSASLESQITTGQVESSLIAKIIDPSNLHYDLSMTLEPNVLSKDGGKIDVELSLPGHDLIKAEGHAIIDWSTDGVQAEGTIEIKLDDTVITQDSLLFDMKTSPAFKIETKGDLYLPVITSTKVSFEGKLDTTMGLDLHAKLNDHLSCDFTLTQESEWYISNAFILTKDHQFVLEGKVGHKELDIKISQDHLSSHIKGQIDQTDEKLQVSCDITNTWLGNMNINAQLDMNKREVKARAELNEKFVEINGILESSLDFSGEVKNNIHQDLQSIEILGKVQILPAKTQFNIIAKSNEANLVNLQGQLGETIGEASMQIDLLEFQHTLNFDYSLSSGQGLVEINVNNDFFKISWSENEVDIETPFESIRKLNAHRSVEGNVDEQRSYFSLDVNDEEILNVMTEFNEEPVSMIISVTTGLSALKNLDVRCKVNSLTDFDLWLAINDNFDARLTGLLSQEHLLYTSKFLLPPFIDYETTLGYKWKASEDKTVDFIIRNPINIVTLQGKIEGAHALLELHSVYFAKKIVEADWDTTEGVMDIVVKTEEVDYLRSALKFDNDPDQPYVGSLNFTTTTVFLENAINVYSKYDIGNDKKNAAMIISVGGEFVTMSSVFKFNEDTFNGELLWKSSLPGYEVAIMNARYNIATQPTASISLENNGKIYYIRTKLSFDNVIPTVRIETSIPGFEKLLFKGNWQQERNSALCDITLSRNQGDVLFMVSTNVRMTPNWSDTELIIEIMTPFANWRSFGAEFGWKQDSPYAFKLKVHKDREQYHLKGRFSLRNKEFNIEAATPFEGFESIALSGKMGTTQLGQHMGISMSQNTVRRDLSMAYEIDDNIAKLQVKMPLDQLSMVNIRIPRSIDNDNMDFAFETEGDQQAHAFGIKYDLSRGPANGDFGLKIKSPYLPTSSVDARLNYNNIDLICENGFDAMFSLLMDDEVMASAEIKRTPGHTTVQVKTPVRGYQNIQLELKSDYATYVSGSIDIDGKVTGAEIRKSEDKLDIDIQTTLRGYEIIKATFELIDDKTVLIKVFRHDVQLTSLKIEAEFYPNRPLMQPLLKMEWKATQSLWANFAMEFDDGKGNITLEAPNKDFKFEFKSEESGDTSIFEAHLELDGETLDYESERVWNDGMITGKSSYTTTMNYQPSNQRTNYEIQYPTAESDRPILLRYETSTSDETTLLLEVKIDATNLPLSVEFEALLNSPESSPIFKAIGNHELKGSYNMSPSEGTFDIAVSYNDQEAKLSFVKSGSEASVELSTNVPGFSSIKGKVKWMSKGLRTKYDFSLEMNGQRLLQGSLGHDQSPFTRFKMVVKFDERNAQEIELKNQNSAGSLFPFDWKVKTKGTWSNLMIRLASNPDPRSKDGMTLIDVSVSGSSYFFGTMDCTTKAVLKLGLREGQVAKYGIDAEITASGRDHAKLLAEATLESLGKGTIDFKLDVALNRIEHWIEHSSEAQLVFEFAAGGFKHILVTVKPPHMQEYKFELKGIWTLENSDFTVTLTDQNSRREKTVLEFVAKRNSYSSIEYGLDVPKKRLDVKFESNINVRRADDFDVSAKLNSQKMPLSSASLELSFNARQFGRATLNGKLEVQHHGPEQDWRINYDHSNHGDLLELIVQGNGCDYLKVKRAAKDNGRLHTLSLNCSPYAGDVELFMDIEPRNLKLILSESWFQTTVETNWKMRMYQFDTSVKLTHPSERVEAELNFDASERGKVDLNGKLEIEGRRGNKREFKIQYEHTNHGDLLELIVSANGCDVLKVKRTAKDNGRLHTVSLNCQSELPPRFGDLDGDFELFVAQTPTPGHLEVTLSETWTGRKMEINLDAEEKELSVDIERSGVKIHEIYAKATPTLPLMHCLLRYKKNGTTKFVVESQFEQPIKGYIDLKMTPIFDMRAEISHDGTDGKLNVKANGNFFEGLSMDLELSNKPEKKEANLEAVYESKKLRLKALSESEGKVEIDLTSDAHPLLEKILFKVDPKDRSTAGFDSLFKWGTQAEKEITLEYSKNPFFKLRVEALGEHHLEIESNMSEQTFKLDSQIGRRDMKIDLSVRDNSVTIEMTDPFLNRGKLTFQGHWEKSSNGVTLDASADFDNVAYKLEMELTSSFCLIVVSKGGQQWSLEANYTPNSIKIVMSNDMELEGNYALDDQHFEAELKLSAPNLVSASAAVKCDFDIPTKMGLSLESTYNDQDIIKVALEFELTETARFNARLHSPPLGLTTEDLGIEIVYRAVAYQDFELKTEIVLPSKRISGGLKFKLESDELLEFEVTMADFKLQLNGQHKDGEIKGNLNDLKLEMKLGYPEYENGTDYELELRGEVPFTDYPIHLESHKSPNGLKFKLELAKDFGFTLRAALEDQEFELGTEIVVPSQNIDTKLELKGEHRNGEIRGNLNDLRFKLGMGNPEYDFKLDGKVPFLEYPLHLEIETDGFKTCNLQLKADDDLELGLMATCDSHPNGHLEFQAEVSFKYGTNVAQSAKIKLETGEQGKVEVTYSGLQSHSMRLEMNENRVRRAIFESDSMGTYAFESDQDTLKGVLVLTTPQGIHKLTYDIDNEEFTLNLKLDSSWIENGHATAFLTFNVEKNLYGIRVALSDQHFMSFSTEYDFGLLDFTFSMESPLVPNINSFLRYRHHERITLDVSFKINDEEHVFKLVLDTRTYTVNSQLDSPCFGHYQVLAELEKLENVYQTNLKAQLLTHEIGLTGNLTVNSCLDFQGNFNLKMLPYQGNLDFQVKLDSQQDTILDIDLTSTHPVLDRLRLQLDVTENISNGYNGIIQTIIPTIDQDVKVTFTIPRTNILSNQASATISNLNSLAQLECQWDFQTGTPQKTLQIVADYPEGGKIALDMSLSNDQSHFVLTSTHFEKMAMKMNWSPDMNLEHGFLLAEVEVLNEKVNVEVTYQMQSDKEIKLAIETSLENYEHFEINLGIAQEERKMLKAHVKLPQSQYGWQMDYHFTSYMDFMLELELDLPIPELKVTSVKLGHVYPNLLVAQIECSLVNAQFQYEAQEDDQMEVKVSFQNYKIELKSLLLEGLQGHLLSKLEIPYGTFELELARENHDFEGKFWINGLRHVFIQNSELSKTFTLEVEDVLYPTGLKVSVSYDNDVTSMSLKTIGDTSSPMTSTEIISWSFRNTDSMTDFHAEITWVSGDTDTFKGLVQKEPGKYQYSFSILHNEQRQLGFDLDLLCQYDQEELDVKGLTKLEFPSHLIKHEVEIIQRRQMVSRTESMMWSTSDSSEPKGLKYHYRVDKNQGQSVDYTFWIQRISDQVTETFSSHYLKTQDKTQLSLSNQHPNDESRCLDWKMEFDTSNSNEQRTSLNLSLDSKFGMALRRSTEANINLDMSNHNLQVQFKDDEDVYHLNCELSLQEVQKILVELQHNGEKALKLEGGLDTETPHITTRIEIGNRKSVQVFGGLQAPNNILFDVKTSYQTSNEVQDIKIDILLTPDGKVLKVDFFWRPDLPQDIDQSIAWAKNDLYERTTESLIRNNDHPSLSTIQHIVTSSISDLSMDLQMVLDFDLVQAWLEPFNELRQNLASLTIHQYQLVQQVSYHTGQAMEYVLTVGLQMTQYGMKASKSLISISYATSYQYIHTSFAMIKSIKSACHELVREALSQLQLIDIQLQNLGTPERIEQALHLVRESLSFWATKMAHLQNVLMEIPFNVSQDLADDVHQALQLVASSLKNVKSLNTVLAFYKDYQSWFEEIHLTSRLQQIYRDFQIDFNDFRANVAQFLMELEQLWNKTVDSINKMLQHYPLLSYTASVGKKAYRLFSAMAHQISQESDFLSLCRRFIGKSHAISTTIIRLIDVIYHGEALMTYDFTYDVSAGTVQYSQTLPFHWFKFQDYPDVIQVLDFVAPKADNQAGAGEQIDYRALQHELLELIMTINQAFRSQSLIPPFSATALMAGNSHLVTFDGKFYDLSARSCSYLLLSDFTDSKFSAIANYDSEMRRTSIDVVTDGHTIQINTATDASNDDDDLIKVTLDRRNVQLPLVFDNTYAYRQDHAIIIENSQGLRVACNTLYNICSFTLSGWYFGKTGGLLGTYDNEPSNDWMTPDRRLDSSLQDFAQAWAINDQCLTQVTQSDEGMANNPELLDFESQSACQETFGAETSALMPCFSTVDPTPYKEMCYKNMRQEFANNADKSLGVCSAAAAYIQMCRQVKVELWMPSNCVNCAIDTELMRHGESTRHETRREQGAVSVDTVFIVEQGSTCLNAFHLSSVPSLIDRSLRNKNLNDNRFALVGYAGAKQLSQPHTYTAGSRIFADAVQVSVALNDLVLKMEDNEDIRATKNDIPEALQFAARLHFRPGVTKSFILLTCGGAVDLSSAQYGDAMTLLSEQGIQLHLMTPLDLQFQGPSNRNRLLSRIYGFNANSVVTASGPNTELRKHLAEPKNLLTTLVQESAGSIYNLNRLEARKRSSVKKASTIISQSIAEENSSHAMECQVCDCLSTVDGQGRLMCHRCINDSIDIVLQNWQKFGNAEQ